MPLILLHVVTEEITFEITSLKTIIFLCENVKKKDYHKIFDSNTLQLYGTVVDIVMY